MSRLASHCASSLCDELLRYAGPAACVSMYLFGRDDSLRGRNLAVRSGLRVQRVVDWCDVALCGSILWIEQLRRFVERRVIRLFHLVFRTNSSWLGRLGRWRRRGVFDRVIAGRGLWRWLESRSRFRSGRGGRLWLRLRRGWLSGRLRVTDVVGVTRWRCLIRGLGHSASRAAGASGSRFTRAATA
jgi:hypothetical protein